MGVGGGALQEWKECPSQQRLFVACLSLGGGLKAATESMDSAVAAFPPNAPQSESDHAILAEVCKGIV